MAGRRRRDRSLRLWRADPGTVDARRWTRQAMTRHPSDGPAEDDTDGPEPEPGAVEDHIPIADGLDGRWRDPTRALPAGRDQLFFFFWHLLFLHSSLLLQQSLFFLHLSPGRLHLHLPLLQRLEQQSPFLSQLLVLLRAAGQGGLDAEGAEQRGQHRARAALDDRPTRRVARRQVPRDLVELPCDP